MKKPSLLLVLLLGGISLVGNLFLFPTQESFPEVSISQDGGVRSEKALLPVIETYEGTLASLVAERKNFVEVNFSDMATRLWEEGVVKKELPIVAVGDPQGWGGTPAGLYSVLSKNKERYSSAAEVYMPWAVGFYGKYFLHGEPYYRRGEKRFTDATGGCVQYSDENAKAIYDFAHVGMSVLVIDKEKDVSILRAPEQELPLVSATSYLVADLASGTILAEKNSEETRLVASLTKLMEAVVVAEHLDLRNSILVQSFMLDAYGATEGLIPGQRPRIVELFYPLLVESSNDTAQVLSYFLGRIRTVELMQAKASALFMHNTVFTDTSGYDPGNTSTAQDVFRLMRYIAFNRPTLLQITKGEMVRTFGEVRFTDLKNKNLFAQDPAFLGGKTGYIVASQYTGAFLFEVPFGKETRTVAIVLLDSPSLEKGEQNLRQDTLNTLEWIERTSSQLEISPKNL